MKKSCLAFVFYPLIALGVVLLGLGVRDFFATQSFLASSKVATGTIISVATTTAYSDGGNVPQKIVTYIPTVQFVASDGKTYVFKSSVNGSDPLTLGGSLSVRYDPKNPHTAVVGDFSSSWLGTVMLLVGGLLLILGALIFEIVGKKVVLVAESFEEAANKKGVRSDDPTP